MVIGEVCCNDVLQVMDCYLFFIGLCQLMDNFIIVWGGVSWFKVFQNDWQVCLVSSLQVFFYVLLLVEQFGLVGVNIVCGFIECVVVVDSGVVVNVEFYILDLLVKSEVCGNLCLLGFVDVVCGVNNNVIVVLMVLLMFMLVSVGVGLCYMLGCDFSLCLDVVWVLFNGNFVIEQWGDFNVYLSVILGF